MNEVCWLFRHVVNPYILDSQGQCETETNKRPQLKKTIPKCPSQQWNMFIFMEFVKCVECSGD